MPNHAAIFPFGYLDDKVWNVSYKLTNMVKVRAAITRYKRITTLMIQNAFCLMKDRCRKFMSVIGHYFDNE